MELTLPRTMIEDLKQAGVRVKSKKDSELGSSSFTLDLDQREDMEINKIYDVLKKPEWKEDCRPLRSQINAYRKMRTDKKGKGQTFRELADALRDYLVEDAIEGWIFRMTPEPKAYLVTGIEFHPAEKTRDGVIPAYIILTYQQNDKGSLKTSRLTFDTYMEGQTAGQVLSSKGFQKETEELLELYQEQLERYKTLRPLYGKQLKLNKTRTWSKNERNRRNMWGREHSSTEVKHDLSKVGGGRLVHNDRISEGVFSSGTRSRYDDPDNPRIDSMLMAKIKATLSEGTEAFSRSPFTLETKVFHLGVHEEFSLHAAHLDIYEYDTEMREKLVLPEMYGEVLDVLTDDMALIQEDIVEGKTGGNVVLCAGPPGVGKTLTAEVYSEFREVPLYKVHSGQLGTTPESIESKLMEVYQRAESWGCPVLLDEFDVFGKARGDNLVQNAVVAVFLRTLEYQNNTIFLTTNRSDTMDDAILSRCSAIINYDYPAPLELEQIWKVQKKQLLPELEDSVIEELMEFFIENDKKMSGRNVKATLQLASRWVKAKDRPLDVSLLKTAASFRGI